jgi:hypothetical protein
VQMEFAGNDCEVRLRALRVGPTLAENLDIQGALEVECNSPLGACRYLSDGFSGRVYVRNSGKLHPMKIHCYPEVSEKSWL